MSDKQPRLAKDMSLGEHAAMVARPVDLGKTMRELLLNQGEVSICNHPRTGTPSIDETPVLAVEELVKQLEQNYENIRVIEEAYGTDGRRIKNNVMIAGTPKRK